MSINLLVKVDQFVAMRSCEAYPPLCLDVVSPKVAAGISHSVAPTVPRSLTTSQRAVEVRSGLASPPRGSLSGATVPLRRHVYTGGYVPGGRSENITPLARLIRRCER